MDAFSKARTKFCLTLHYNRDNSYLFVNGKKSLCLKLIMEMPIFIFNFDELDLNELEKVPSGLSNMKSEIDKLDIGKLKTRKHI